MAYASRMHVEAVNAARGTYTATSHPNATQVDQFIDQAAGMMDSFMAKNEYLTPIAMGTTSTPSSAQAELQRINAVGAAYFAEVAAQVSNKKDEFQQMWESALTMLEKDELPGLGRTSDTASPRWDASYPTPMFSRDMDL